MFVLKRLLAANYKAFRSIDLELPEVGLVFVTGANNAGKSALLSSFEVLRGAGLDDWAIYGDALASDVSAIFAISKEDAEGLTATQAWPFRADAAIRDIGLHWRKERGYPVGLRAIDVGLDSGDRHFLTVAKWEGNSFQIRTRARETPLEYGVELPQASSGSGARQAATIPTELVPFYEQWRQRYYHMHVLKRNISSRGTAGSAPSLAADGSNLLQVLLHLEHNDQEKWTDLLDLLGRVLPEVGNLRTPMHDNQAQIAFEARLTSGAHLQDLAVLGTGVEQLLMTFVVALTQSPPHTIILEEPESALHPGAQRVLLSLLRTWSTDRLFIVATHSPVMVDWAPSGAMICLVKRQDGDSEVRVLEGGAPEVLLELGVRLSDVLAAERVLLVEGPSDRDILGVWFRDWLLDPKVAVVPTFGGEAARHSRAMGEWFEAAEVLPDRRVLFIRDRDELGQNAIESLERDGRVHVLVQRELENYLLNPEALTVYLNELAPSPVLLVQNDVAQALEQAIDGEFRSVLIRRVLADVPALRLSDHEFRNELVAEGVSADVLVSRVLARLPASDDLAATLMMSWNQHETELSGAWQEHRRALVGGADVLDSVFRSTVARRFKKRTDGPGLARLTERPKELEQLLEGWLGA